MKRTRIIRALTAISAAALLAACSPESGEKTAEAGEDTQAAATVFAVNTSTAVEGKIVDYLALSGDIVAGSTVDTHSDVAGKVSKLYVSIGDRVRKDAPIAEVDPSRPGMNFVPGLVKAPISGTIVALPAQLGMTVSQAVPLARIAADDTLDLRVHVAERFISEIHLGQKAEVSLDAYPGQIFNAAVKELSPVVDPASRTMEVLLRLDNKDSLLKSGMFAKVKIITQEKSGVVKVPSRALIERFGEMYIFVVETDPADPAFQLARKRVVVPGIQIDEQVEIISGLKNGEEIVVRGQTLLDEGVRVNVVDRIAPVSASN